MTSKKMDKIIKLVKENNPRNNVEIVSNLLAVKQYLERLERLEKDYEKLKERYKHRAETSNDLCKAVKQYEKAIEILKDKLELHHIKHSKSYTMWCIGTRIMLSKQDYEILKEVLE